MMLILNIKYPIKSLTFWGIPSIGWFCAAEETRTLTPLKAPPPQGGVSTNSTTAALGNVWQIYLKQRQYAN